jgi:N-acetylmuramoyl-L-alanine amidase
MDTTFRPMRGAITALILWTAALATACAADWTLIKQGGRDYVTLANVASFYSLGGMQGASSTFKAGTSGRNLRGRVGSPELYINNLTFNLSYPIAESGGQPLIARMDLTKLIEPIMRPSRIRNAEPVHTVVLDPGHGGHDHGAASRLGYEKDYTLDVALRAREILQRQGFRVVMTRTTDVFIPLEERTRFANQYSNALFISIHFNDGGREATGIETYTLAPRGVPSMMADGPRVTDFTECRGNARDAENIALACAAHSAMISRSRLYDRGIKRARFVVIRDIAIPGVLVEGGFLSNSYDSALIATPDYRSQLALCIAGAVVNYRRAVTQQPEPSLLAGQSVGLRKVDAETPSLTIRPNEPAQAPVVETPATTN